MTCELTCVGTAVSLHNSFGGADQTSTAATET
jgi:hypothetical protein